MTRPLNIAALVIIPVAILLLAARLTSGVSHAANGPAPTAAMGAELAPFAAEDTAVFAGGCFWGVEAVFDHVKGVYRATSGYAGGTLANPSYEQVSTGDTGYAESVEVIYDPSVVSYGKLLQIFFSVAHDPTELNRQGPDSGTQYRSAIFYLNDDQKRVARDTIGDIDASGRWQAPVVTEVTPASDFWEAEPEHQDYLQRVPGGYTCHYVRPGWRLPPRAASRSRA